jgi:glycosyltransferase involved in cell wall biosynthesis
VNDDILLISDRSPFTGIGNYSFQLFKHLKKLGRKKVNFLNLLTIAEDSYGGILKVSVDKTKRIIDHLLFLRVVPRGYKLYHILNPNLSILSLRCKPSVVTVHDLYPFTEAARKELMIHSFGLDFPVLEAMKFNMRFIKSADKIICVSEYTKKELISLMRINASKVHVIHLGVDHNRFHPRNKLKTRQKLKLPMNKKIVLHVGVDEPRKNIETLLKAFHKVEQKLPGTILIRIGGMRAETAKQIATLNLKNALIYLEKVPNIELYYNAADVLVFPSYYEGFGLPILEAMASGLPVIAGNSTSIPEVLGGSGILLPPSNIEILSEVLNQLLTDEKLREELSFKGLKRSKKFNWETCAKKTIEVYKTLGG